MKLRSRILVIVLGLILCLGTAGCSPDVFRPDLPTGEVTADIRVDKVEGLDADFVKGVDVSSVISLERSGVVFKNAEGKEQDIFHTLADAGVNCIRVRVWNDPFDAEGRGYGGGNCDVNNAVEIGRRAAKYNLTLLVDFHYSDFWADPTNQLAPKEWADYPIEKKEKSIYDFTKNSLAEIKAGGGKISYVQIGNEINNGLCGETEAGKKIVLLKRASAAVRDYDEMSGERTKIIVHYTEPNRPNLILNEVEALDGYGLDYDIFGLSFYSYWHGTMNNLTTLLRNIKAKVGKDTMVVETAYPYTLTDGDGYPNNVSTSDLVQGYSATVQGQADNLRDVIHSTHLGGGKGVFYWEPAWIPVGREVEYNRTLWIKYGSGWATQYAAGYMPSVTWYGGSSWDNQALFDIDGVPLDSLDTFKYVNFGSVIG